MWQPSDTNVARDIELRTFSLDLSCAVHGTSSSSTCSVDQGEVQFPTFTGGVYRRVPVEAGGRDRYTPTDEFQQANEFQQADEFQQAKQTYFHSISVSFFPFASCDDGRVETWHEQV